MLIATAKSPGVASASACVPALTAAADALVSAYRARHRALLFGTGGSGADAQHLAAEFLGRYLRVRDPMPALALNANTSALTVIDNDYSYEKVSGRQLEAVAASGRCERSHQHLGKLAERD